MPIDNDIPDIDKFHRETAEILADIDQNGLPFTNILNWLMVS